ncbi:MAG: ABC transporter substrate-binding protein [Sphaerochaetaceae bacterium]|nr:ABC transporter substrate-binding protein [Sphaerochaetaceae bacterium]
MKKTLVVLLMVAMACTFAFAGGEEEAKSVKVGYIGPMTGDYANYGVYIGNGAKLAVDKFNAAGGIDGTPVELIIEDSEGAPDKGLSAIEKLSGSDHVVALIGPVFSGVCNAVGPRCQDEGLLMCTPSGTEKSITSIGDYVFRTIPSDGLQSEVAGTYFYQELGYKKLGCLYAKNDYSQGLYEGTKAVFEALGGDMSSVETCQVGDKDFKTQLTKLKSSDVEAIYIPNYTAEMAQILEQASQIGINVPFLSSDGFSNPEIYNLAPKFCDGVIYVGPPQVKLSSAYSDFVSEYNKAFGRDPSSFATASYDAASLLMQVITEVYEKTGKYDRKVIRDTFASTEGFEGVTGTIAFDEIGDLVSFQGLYKVNGIKPEYLGTYTVVNGELAKMD